MKADYFLQSAIGSPMKCSQRGDRNFVPAVQLQPATQSAEFQTERSSQCFQYLHNSVSVDLRLAAAPHNRTPSKRKKRVQHHTKLWDKRRSFRVL